MLRLLRCFGPVAVFLACGCSSSGDDSCATVGPCRIGVEARGAGIAGSITDLKGATVRACRGSACASSTLQATSGAVLTCDSGLSCSAESQGTAFQMTVFLAVEQADAVDGETYSFQVIASNGKRLVDTARPVTFRREAPRCGSTCMEATVAIP